MRNLPRGDSGTVFTHWQPMERGASPMCLYGNGRTTLELRRDVRACACWGTRSACRFVTNCIHRRVVPGIRALAERGDPDHPGALACTLPMTRHVSP